MNYIPPYYFVIHFCSRCECQTQFNQIAEITVQCDAITECELESFITESSLPSHQHLIQSLIRFASQTLIITTNWQKLEFLFHALKLTCRRQSNYAPFFLLFLRFKTFPCFVPDSGFFPPFVKGNQVFLVDPEKSPVSMLLCMIVENFVSMFMQFRKSRVTCHVNWVQLAFARLKQVVQSQTAANYGCKLILYFLRKREFNI